MNQSKMRPLPSAHFLPRTVMRLLDQCWSSTVQNHHQNASLLNFEGGGCFKGGGTVEYVIGWLFYLVGPHIFQCFVFIFRISRGPCWNHRFTVGGRYVQIEAISRRMKIAYWTFNTKWTRHSATRLRFHIFSKNRHVLDIRLKRND